MTARNGLTVEVRVMPNGKNWAFVTTKTDGSPVAFSDWYDMVRAIGTCEVLKYRGNPSNVVDWFKWTEAAKLFLIDCFEFDATYEDLRVKHGLPR